MLQVCDDARAGEVLNDFAQIYVFSPTSTKQGTLYTLTANTPAAADFLLTHAAKPDRGNGSLRFVHGAAGYLTMAKLLPFIFALPVAAWRTKSRFSVGESSWLGMSGTSAWLAVYSGRLSMDAQRAKLELRQFLCDEHASQHSLALSTQHYSARPPTATLRCRGTRWRFTVQCPGRRVPRD